MFIDFFFNVYKWRYLIYVLFVLRFRGKLEFFIGVSIIYELFYS